jgi:hypothetical protein
MMADTDKEEFSSVSVETCSLGVKQHLFTIYEHATIK